MTKGTTTLGSKLAWTTLSGLLVTIVGLFWIDSPPTLFAQVDTTSPTVSSVAITSDTGDDEVYLDDDGVYGIGNQIEVTVTFNENVTVTGLPKLEVTIGSNVRAAAYKSTKDSKVVFSYAVAVGDSDTDGISIAADTLNLNGGSIKGAGRPPGGWGGQRCRSLPQRRVDAGGTHGGWDQTYNYKRLSCRKFIQPRWCPHHR